MFKGDMDYKMERSKEKVHHAIEGHGGCTILSTGMTGDDARLAKAAVDSGIKMLEPNHPALALARGYKGVTSMHDAEMIRHEININQMVEVVRGIRGVVPEDVFITVGIPGGFTELVPTYVEEEDFYQLSRNGADGIHTHKSTLNDLQEWTEIAHKYGLLVDAYIGSKSDKHRFGICAETPEEVFQVAKDMQSIGVDMIGLMTGMSYNGTSADQIHPLICEKLVALSEAVDVPIIAEGGINLYNCSVFKDLKVNILVIGTAIDDILKKIAYETLRQYINKVKLI